MKTWQLLLPVLLPLLMVLLLSPLWLQYFSAAATATVVKSPIAKVDLAAVIADMARHRASRGDAQRANRDAEVVTNALQVLAQQYELLLDSGVVIAGAEDITPELRWRLQQQDLLPGVDAGEVDVSR